MLNPDTNARREKKDNFLKKTKRKKKEEKIKEEKKGGKMKRGLKLVPNETGHFFLNVKRSRNEIEAQKKNQILSSTQRRKRK